MSATASANPGLMRERAGVLPNTLALAYAVCGYAGGFLLMAAPPWWANAAGVVLDDDYGSVGQGPGRADRYVGAHGVSFLTVV